jgi:hypothetical protein
MDRIISSALEDTSPEVVSVPLIHKMRTFGWKPTLVTTMSVPAAAVDQLNEPVLADKATG